MRVPVYLEIAQWALLFALGILVVVMYRQLGRLLGKSGKTADLGPAVGTTATPFRYQKLPGGMTAQFRPGSGTPALIAFVDPSCPACEQLVTNLTELAAGQELSGTDVLLLISDPPSYLSISAAFQETTLPVGRPLSAEEVAGYRASGTPLLVAVDGAGTVRASGVVRLVPEIRTFVASAAGRSGEAHDAVTTRESEAVR